MIAQKKLICSADTDVNMILPVRYTWARQHYKNSVANNWIPEEIPMEKDREQWETSDVLTENERHLIMWNLGFFSNADNLTVNNIPLAISRHVVNPECRQFMLRQAYEGAIHADAFIHCCDSLKIEPRDIYEAHEAIPSTTIKNEFTASLTKTLLDPGFEIKTTKDKQLFLLDVIGYVMVIEGIFFYSGFVMMLQLMRSNKMKGMGEQFQYILRDKSVHIAYGRDLIKGIVVENPDIWTEEFGRKVHTIFQKAIEIEMNYINDCLPYGLLGLDGDAMKQYIRYIIDRRCEMINLPILFGDENPFLWMSEIIDLKREKNFFEAKVTEYHMSGNLEW